jgi:hypothetical protein
VASDPTNNGTPPPGGVEGLKSISSSEIRLINNIKTNRFLLHENIEETQAIAAAPKLNYQI